MRASLANLPKLFCLCGCLILAAGCDTGVETMGDNSPAATGNTPDLTTDPAASEAAVDANDAQTDVSIDLNRDSEDVAGERPRLRERIGERVEGVDVNAGEGGVNVEVE